MKVSDALNRKLLTAVEMGNVTAAEKAIGQGADVHSRDRLGTPLLMIAVTGGHLDLVRLLLAKGADPNERSGLGLTALMAASSMGNTDMVGSLLVHGAKIDAQDDQGVTALHAAAAWGQEEVVKELLKFGANPMLKNKKYRQAVDDAKTGAIRRILSKAMYPQPVSRASLLTLGLESGANWDDVRRAYKKLSLKYHPDRQFSKSQEEKDDAQQKLQEIQNAYEDIKNYLGK